MKFLKFDSMATILIMDWAAGGTQLTQHVDCLELECLATATAGDKLEEFSGTVARPGPEVEASRRWRGILKILGPTDTMIDRTNSTVTATATIPQSHG